MANAIYETYAPAVEAFLAQPHNHAAIYSNLPPEMPPLRETLFEDLNFIVHMETVELQVDTAEARHRAELLWFAMDILPVCDCGNPDCTAAIFH
jgi:hypothetical protein